KPLGHSIRTTASASGTSSAQSILGALDEQEALKGVIAEVLDGDPGDFLRQLDDRKPRAAGPVAGTDVGAKETWETAKGIIALLLGSESTPLDKRMRALLRAIRGLQKEDSFNPKTETLKEYLDAARELSKGGFRYVVFGHTHQAKCIEF